MSLIGRFHEIGIETPDILSSIEFYQRLGFTQASAGDTWTHPYCVLTDGRITLGLHQHRLESPLLTFVRSQVAEQIGVLESRGIELALRNTGDEVFNMVGFRDPSGQMVRVLEARTYSPAAVPRDHGSLCGDFAEFSIPCSDWAAAASFWEGLGFVATEEAAEPYAHLPLTSDSLNIAFHRPRTQDRAMLVFRGPGTAARLARLRALGVATVASLPPGLSAAHNGLLEAPEGTALLLLDEAA